MAVLQSIPWQKVDIEVLSVETDLAGLFQKGKKNGSIMLYEKSIFMMQFEFYIYVYFDRLRAAHIINISD